MENQVVDAVTLGQSVMSHDMSLWGLFMQAGLVVKVVMIGLLMASNARGIKGDTMRARLQQRLERTMETTLGREMDRVERYMTFLASVGSTAPFVGLFGTVWGIMVSFQAIAASKNTSLAVVAPGIAEALLATAMGLVAAIPAVVAYNKISSDLNRYNNRLEAFVDEFTSILSRQLDDARD